MAPSASTASDEQQELLTNDDSLSLLRRFTFTRILSEDTLTRTIVLLGTFARAESGTGEDVPALLTIERQSIDREAVQDFVASLAQAKMLLRNDVYHLFVGWSGAKRASQTSGAGVAAPESQPDLKITLRQPASDKEIRKYTQQGYRMVRETPELYEQVVKPYIAALPASRLQWVYNILAHVTESETIIYEDTDPVTGFILLPDLKWDRKTTPMLYCSVIVHTRSIASLRDLGPQHLPLLRNIRQQSEAAVIRAFGLKKGELRMFVHYQPSFYHFHVHVVHVSCHGYSGATIGQAHLLDTIIDNLEQELEMPPHPSGKSYYARRTLAYGLGERHDLFPLLWQGE